MKHDRAKHEAMLRREMMALLNDWPTNPRCIPEPSQADKQAFCEWFVRISRPAFDEPQPDLFA